MIRSFLSYQMVANGLLGIRLHDFLQDSLAIKKERLILKIVQNKTMDKLFRISKPTIHINRSNQRLKRVRSNRIPFPAAGGVLPLPKQQIPA